MKILEELNKIKEAKNSLEDFASLATQNVRELKRLKDTENQLDRLIPKQIKQALAVRDRWVAEEAKVRLLELAADRLSDLIASPTQREGFREEVGVSDLSDVNPKSLIRDLVDFQKDNAIDFVRAEGVTQDKAAFEKSLIRAITRTKV